MPKQLIVVDVESTGLIPQYHVPLEVAAVNLETGEELYFVPFVHPDDLGNADPCAMQVNRYYERGVWRHQVPPSETQSRYDQLFDMLRGNTLAGANPRFDAEMIRWGKARADAPMSQLRNSNPSLPDETWHYRLADIQSYYCGVMGTDPAEPARLVDITDQLNIHHDDSHSALADARATAAAFRNLQERRRQLASPAPDAPY